MKKMTITNIITALEKSFDVLNEMYYKGELKRPVITLSEGSKIRAYGWFVYKDVWHEGENSAAELNISCDYLNRDVKDIITTMMHEMVHCYCYQFGVKDTSRRGAYHNRKFKEVAEEHGMFHPDEQADGRLGWSSVKIRPFEVEKILIELSFLQESLTIYRDEAVRNEKKKSKNNQIKYICPSCFANFRATSEVHATCTICDCEFVIENK